MTVVFNKFCLSSFLTFRYVVKENIAWTDGLLPLFPKESRKELIHVDSSDQIFDALSGTVRQTCSDKKVGILLSGGIDSAILAALMPPQSHAYTVKFCADNSTDESVKAAVYAQRCHLNHHVVEVSWQDHLDNVGHLMCNKRSPLHPVEVGLFKAASTAFRDGIHTLIIGNGADSTFGGMDKLLSRDWRFAEFVKRYTFVEPSTILKEPVSMLPLYEEYRAGDGIDVTQFLKIIHGRGIIQAFDNAIGSAGVKTIEPYERLYLDAPLNLDRIRKGESKYLLRKIFEQLYPDLDVPEKIPFARPMDEWMACWPGPRRSEFADEIDLSSLTGEQKWLVFILEGFLDLMETGHGFSE